VTVAPKEAAAVGDGDAEWREAEGVGDDERCVREGEGDGEWEAAGETEIDGVGGGGEVGSSTPTGTGGGTTTVGSAALSWDGPTARTATQTTSATRTVTADTKMRRAGLSGEECLAAGNGLPFGTQPVGRSTGLGRAHYLINPCLWHGGPPPG
jgi:hypothetical protein